jgi:pilus assembly protein Flp/PilA
MRPWLRPVLDFLRRDDGPTAVEYAIMLALIILVCFATIATLGTTTSGVFTNVTLINQGLDGGT